MKAFFKLKSHFGILIDPHLIDQGGYIRYFNNFSRKEEYIRRIKLRYSVFKNHFSNLIINKKAFRHDRLVEKLISGNKKIVSPEGFNFIKMNGGIINA